MSNRIRLKGLQGAVRVTAGGGSAEVPDYGVAALDPPGPSGPFNLLEIGSVRSVSNANDAAPATEAIDTGAPAAGKRLLILVAWGDADETVSPDLIGTIDGQPMRMRASENVQRTNATALSYDIPGGGVVNFAMQPDTGTQWRGYSYRVFTVEGAHTLDPVTFTANNQEPSDFSADVFQGTEMIGVAYCNNDADAGFVIAGAETDAAGEGFGNRAFVHFSHSSTIEETPRTVTLTPAGAANGVTVGVAIYINPPGAVAQIPVIAEAPRFDVNQNSTDNLLDVLSLVTDPNGDTVSVTEASCPDGTVVIEPDYRLRFAPTPQFIGATQITFTVSDGQGNEASGTIDVAVADIGDFQVVAHRTAVLEDGTAQALEIITPPARGHMVVRDDGRLSFNLNEDSGTDDLVVVYDKTVDGVTTRIEADITVEAPELIGGWDKGQYYLPEVHPVTDDLVIEPGPQTRIIHCRPDGKSISDVALEQGIGEGAVVNQIRLNPQWGYGESDANALNQDLAQSVVRSVSQDWSSPWLLFKRGETYASAEAFGNAQSEISRPGEGGLHPIVLGAYGTGARPHFAGNTLHVGFGCANIAVCNMSFGFRLLASGTNNIALDDVATDYSDATAPQAAIILGGTNRYPTRRASLRRTNVQNSGPVGLTPHAGSTAADKWDNSNDRWSAWYFSVADDVLIEKTFNAYSGWGPPPYRMDATFTDGVTTWDKGPWDRGHGFYLQVKVVGVTAREYFTLRPEFAFCQFRTGAIAMDLLGVEANSGALFGGGWGAETDGDNWANWSLSFRVTQIGAGLKKSSAEVSGSPVVGKGMAVSAPRLSRIQSGIFNAGEPTWVSDTSALVMDRALVIDEGTQINAGEIGGTHIWTGVAGYVTGQDDYIVNNWDRDGSISGNAVPDVNVGGVAQATRDALTVERWLDDELSRPAGTSTRQDFFDHVMADPEPWRFAKIINDWLLSPFGKTPTPRNAAQTVQFRPYAGGDTPGIRADIPLDWDTGDLPGTVAGDSIDLAGHKLWWNMTPRNTIADLSFGAGGEMHMLGGALRPSGVVQVDAAGNPLTVKHGAKFDLPGYGGNGQLDITAFDARVLNSGSVQGNINVKGQYLSEIIFGYDTASWTFGSGDTLTIEGYCRAGFDGRAGGTATLTLGTGSTLAFSPTLRLAVDDTVDGYVAIGGSGGGELAAEDKILPKLGSTITGVNSGATGVVLDYVHASPDGGTVDVFLILSQLTGRFEQYESLSCPDLTLRQRIPQNGGIFGTVKDSPDYVLGSIREVQTGLNMQEAPDGSISVAQTDVVSEVGLGGALHLDISGLDNGTYTLIDVDTLTGAFAEITASGNDAKDISVTISGSQAQITITDGSGQILGD